MPIRQRLTGSAALLAIGLVALLFLGGSDVTRCLGPLGRTLAEAIRDHCLTLNVGIGVPIGAGTIVGAILNLLPSSESSAGRSFLGALLAGALGLAAYLVIRPATLTGPTSTGQVITVPLVFDWPAFATYGIVAAGIGLLLVQLLGRSRSGRSS